MNAIEARSLEFGYAGRGGFDLRVDEFVVGAGEQIAIVGPSGCGKSTLLHLCAGILEAREGSLTVAGHKLDGASEATRRQFRLQHIGLVFQEFELLEHLSVRENVLLPFALGRPEGEAARPPRPQLHERAERLAEATGIAPLLSRKPRRLSQGERQRVALCRALITEPQVVLADEPTGNLDPANARKALDLLFEQVRALGASLVVVTHDHGLLGDFDRSFDAGALAQTVPATPPGGTA